MSTPREIRAAEREAAREAREADMAYFPPTATNFTQDFLSRARITHDPAGDLIADMRRDPKIPALLGSIREMRGYLHRCGACPETIEAVPVVWRRYSSWLMRNPMGKRDT